MRPFAGTWQCCRPKCTEPDWLPNTWTRNWLAGKKLELTTHFRLKLRGLLKRHCHRMLQLMIFLTNNIITRGGIMYTSACLLAFRKKSNVQLKLSNSRLPFLDNLLDSIFHLLSVNYPPHNQQYTHCTHTRYGLFAG